MFADWVAPVNVGPPVNSSEEESGPAISEDGRSLYFNRNPNLAGVDADEDLFVAHREGPRKDWGVPVPLVTINTPTFHERNVAISPDGLLLFFSSNRNVDDAGNAVGFGGLDLYTSRTERTNDSGWSPPVNLGPSVNGPADEVGPGVVTFAEDRSLSVGPPSFVAELNRGSEDARPTIRKDALEVIFHSRRPPSLGRDLWVSTRATPIDPWSTPIQLTTVNSSTNDLQASLSDDGETLLFSSSRESGLGQDDIWRSRRDMLTRE
jgi:hypothetical protein